MLLGPELYNVGVQSLAFRSGSEVSSGDVDQRDASDQGDRHVPLQGDAGREGNGHEVSLPGCSHAIQRWLLRGLQVEGGREEGVPLCLLWSQLGQDPPGEEVHGLQGDRGLRVADCRSALVSFRSLPPGEFLQVILDMLTKPLSYFVTAALQQDAETSFGR